MLLDSIAEITDFKQTEFNKEQIVNEFRNKFNGSIVYINKKLYKIVDCTNSLLICINGDKVEEVLDLTHNYTIEKFLPKTGLYKIGEKVFYLHRIPFKQWIKSFSLGNNYKAFHFAVSPNIEYSFLQNKCTYLGNTAIVSGNVYLYWKLVGNIDVNPQKIVLRSVYENLKSIVEETWKQYPVIMEQFNQKKKQEEKLMLDF